MNIEKTLKNTLKYVLFPTLLLMASLLLIVTGMYIRNKQYDNKEVYRGYAPANEIAPDALLRGINKIVVTDSLPDDINGRYNETKGIIELKSGVGENNHTLIHELSHSFGHRTGAQYTNEWKEIYNEEWKHLDVYGATNENEAFAEAMTLLINGDELENGMDIFSHELQKTFTYITDVAVERGVI